MLYFEFILWFQFFWAFGSAFLVGTSLIVMPTLGWRWLLGIATVPVAIFVILCKVSKASLLEILYCTIANMYVKVVWLK